MELFFELHDNEDVCHKKFSSEFGVDATFKQMKEKIRSKFYIDSEDQHLFSVDRNEINGPSSSSLLEIGLKNLDKIVVKHARIEDWRLYRDYVETVLKNRRAPNLKDLVESANSINQALVATGFFEAYRSFQDYRDRNHWRIVKYLDGETPIIAAASREHFAILNAFKGGSQNDFHFEYEPKNSTGTRCGIILHVQLGDTKEKCKWQVKAHHHRGSAFSAEITDPDIRELFCYKFFELIGVGPEVRFIIPSKDLGSKMAVYIGTRWRDDFVPLSLSENNEALLKSESLVQLHLLQVLLHVEDLHGLNCGTWKESNTAAIVDFCMGVERKDSMKHFLQRYNTKLPWDDRSKELFESIPRKERLDIAKKWLERWNFLSKIDEADSLVAQVKDILKKNFAMKFRGYDTDEDNEVYNAQVTDDLKAYIDLVKSNVKAFLE